MNDRHLVKKKLIANNSKSVKRVLTPIQTIKTLSSQLKVEKEKSRTVIATDHHCLLCVFLLADQFFKDTIE